MIAGLSAVPLVGGPISVVANELLERRRARVAQFGAELLDRRDVDEVLERLRSDERFGELFVRAAETTAFTSWQPKRRAMGAVVGMALDGDETQLDDSELLLAALERLDAPHFAALERLDQVTALLEEDKAGVDAAEIGGLNAPVMAALIATGAVTQQSGIGGLFYKSSEFGRRLLALVTM